MTAETNQPDSLGDAPLASLVADALSIAVSTAIILRRDLSLADQAKVSIRTTVFACDDFAKKARAALATADGPTANPEGDRT